MSNTIRISHDDERSLEETNGILDRLSSLLDGVALSKRKGLAFEDEAYTVLYIMQRIPTVDYNREQKARLAKLNARLDVFLGLPPVDADYIHSLERQATLLEDGD